MFLQPASFMIYDFMTYHGIKACTRMRPVLRTARWKSKRNKRIEVQVEEERVRLGFAEALRKDAQRVVRVKFALRYDGSMCCIPCCSIESSFD